MNFTSKEYLPDSEERINHLRKIIDGRPVAILAAGPSINELEKRICELNNTEICYFIFNDFINEIYILKQIDKSASVIMYACYNGMQEIIERIVNFLNRDEDNMFVSSIGGDAVGGYTFGLLGPDFDLNRFISEFNRKLIFFSISADRKTPNIDYPLHFSYTNSLLILIQLAIIGKASRIILFGSDGYCEKNIDECYYRPHEYCGGGASSAQLIHDTYNFNALAPILIKNVYKTYNLKPIEILNCSDGSFYTTFPTVSYDDAFEYLITGKKFDRKTDLRVPKVSIISLYFNNEKFLKETIQNISGQSYTNYEHIIIYNENDDKIWDIIQQFPFIIWIPVKSSDTFKALKEGISAARGDYVFYCRSGDGYLDQDWFCTCVEILDYNPDISLVWGISQNMYKNDIFVQMAKTRFSDKPPKHSKNFIYHWFHRNVLFPEGNSCVRKNILEECFPFSDSKARIECEAWAAFNYSFNVLGYQPFFVPILANYCRTQGNTEGQSPDQNTQNWIKEYYGNIKQYKQKLIDRKTVHHYRDGRGELLPETFNRGIYIFFNISRHINGMLPDNLFIDFEKYLDFWMVNRWKILTVGPIVCWHRLITTRKIKPLEGE